MKYNKPREKLLTGPVLFICAMYISNTLIGTSASRWYCCRFAVCRGTLLGLHKPTDTEPLIHRLAMNQLESTDGLDFFAKISFMKKKEAQLTERKFKNNNNNNKYKKPDLPYGKKKTENHIEVSISHLSRSLIITYRNYFIDRRAVNVSGITIPESFSRHLNFKDDLIQRSRVGIHLYLCLSFASSCQRI